MTFTLSIPQIIVFSVWLVIYCRGFMFAFENTTPRNLTETFQTVVLVITSAAFAITGFMLLVAHW